MARPLQRLEPYGSRCDFRLLVRRLPQILTKSAPVSLVAKQRNTRGAARVFSIAEARTVTENRDLIECRSLSLIVAHA